MSETADHDIPPPPSPLPARPGDELKEVTRKDLVELGQNFVEAVEPVRRVIVHMKTQTEALKDMSTHLRQAVFYLKALGALALAGMALHFLGVARIFWTAEQMDQQRMAVERLSHDQREAIDELVHLRKAQQEVKREVAEAKQEAKSESKVTLVPETDPVKARSAPLKVRIQTAPHTAPSASKKPAAPAAPIVELPIPSKAAHSIEVDNSASDSGATLKK